MKKPDPATENHPAIDATKPYVVGLNPQRDAWYTAFFIENHLDAFAFPDQVASPEKVRFIVYTDEEERYYPCSDRMFGSIMNRRRSAFLQAQYAEALERVMAIVDRQIEDDDEKAYLLALLRYKYEHETREELMIPSRLEKRLINIFLNRTQIEDPSVFDKAMRNRRVHHALTSDAFIQAFNQAKELQFSELATIADIRSVINHCQLRRLLALSVVAKIWESDAARDFATEQYMTFFDQPLNGNGLAPLMEFLGIHSISRKDFQPKKILWLPDESGEVLIDLAIIQFLVKLGHKVIIALKDGPLYTKVACPDCRSDEILRSHLEDALWITDKNLTKNELVDLLRSDNHIFIISDGTRENLNLMLATTTFARIFKEVDGVISKGLDQKRRLFYTHFQFTQDIFNISTEEDGNVVIDYKPRHPAVIKFSHKDLEDKAEALIEKMRKVRKNGMTVMFYSGIIGSIPGRIPVAKQVMSTTVDYLREQSALTFIINPSEHFEPGMDADDLMYMWEIVQNSGLIDIWRFQTYEDIVHAFQLMDKKVPPEWVGKDATFSTGCTKEMNIAIQVQKEHPEMQIIGPAKEKFMRRAEYGIGKMYDKRLMGIGRI
jgi:hypothetical protein